MRKGAGIGTKVGNPSILHLITPAYLVKRFLDSGLTGFYFRVLQEGEVAAGDGLERLDRDPHNVTIVDIAELYRGRSPSAAALQRAIQVPALPEDWREYFQKQLDRLTPDNPP